MHVPFDVPEDGDYELLAQIAHSPDYGVYDVLLDGKAITPDVRLEHEPGANLGTAAGIDSWHSEIYVAEDHTLGWKKLTRGRHVLTFVCVGKNLRSQGYNIGVDTLILARLGKVDDTGGERAAAIRRTSDAGQLSEALRDSNLRVREAAAWRLTQLPALAEVATATLTDPDPVVRGLATLAVANQPAIALKEANRLMAALKDPDENVRMVSAEALAVAKPESAVPALIAAAQEKGEHVHVLRSIAKALGAIGPKASAAAPALEDLRQIPRVQWAAEDALRKIGRVP